MTSPEHYDHCVAEQPLWDVMDALGAYVDARVQYDRAQQQRGGEYASTDECDKTAKELEAALRAWKVAP